MPTVGKNCTIETTCKQLDLYACVNGICDCSPTTGFTGDSCLETTTLNICAICLFSSGLLVSLVVLYKCGVLYSFVRASKIKRNHLLRKNFNAREVLSIILIVSSLTVSWSNVQGILLNVNNFNAHWLGYYSNIVSVVVLNSSLSATALIVGLAWLEVALKNGRNISNFVTLERFKKISYVFLCLVSTVTLIELAFSLNIAAIMTAVVGHIICHAVVIFGGKVLSKAMSTTESSAVSVKEGERITKTRRRMSVTYIAFLLLLVAFSQFTHIRPPLSAALPLLMTFALFFYQYFLIEYAYGERQRNGSVMIYISGFKIHIAPDASRK